MDTLILSTIKKLLGIEEPYTVFDQDLVIYINSAFMELNQLGYGPHDEMFVADESTPWSTWIEYVGINGMRTLEMVKQFVYMKTRATFDPPQTSSHVSAFNETISELEYRLNIAVDK